jgi:pyruvate dehydrogenase E1 component beta subunit
LKSAVRDPNPVVFLENEILYGQSFDISQEALSDDFTIPIGKAKIERAGTDITIVSHSIGMNYAMQAAEILKKEEGVEAEVINLRTISPLDVDTIIASVKKTNRIVTVESGFPLFSVGSEITATVNDFAFDHLDAPVERVTGASVPTPYAENLEKLSFPDTAIVVRAAKRALYK